MPEKRVGDQFANVIYGSVTESAAGTLTFTKLETGYGSLNRVGWVVHKLEFYLAVGMSSLIIDNADAIQMAVTKSNLISSVTLDQAAVIDLCQMQFSYRTSVGFAMDMQPIIRDFTMLPGGGKLVLPYPLFLAVKGISLASAVTVATRISFTEQELTDKDWLELVEQTRLLA